MPSELKKRKSPKQTALTFGSADYDSSVYEEVANSGKLAELALVDQSFSVKINDFWKAEAEELDQKFSFSGEPDEIYYTSEKGFCGGNYKWKAEIRIQRRKALKLSCSYFIVYHGLIDLDEPHVLLYFKKLARFASYPYFRAVFATCASSSGLTLPPLPVLNDRVD